MKTGFVAVLALIVACAAAWANNSMDVSQELDTQYSYVGGARTRGAGVNTDSVDENSADVKYVVCPQVNKDLLLRLGFEWERFSFDVPDHAGVPPTLQQISGVLGFDYQIADEWIMRMEIEPGIYSDFRDISFRDFDAPLILGGIHLVSADVQWFFGLRIDLRTQYPVLPAAGVRWKLSDKWTLNFMLPNPRVEYSINEKLKLYAGGGIEAGTFAVGENFGTDHGEPKLNGSIVDFLEFRFGTGCSWKITPILTIEAEGGFMPFRDFDFFDHDVDIRSHNAPYAQLACHARF